MYIYIYIRCDRSERLSKLSRTIAVGNMVWCLHGLGMILLDKLLYYDCEEEKVFLFVQINVSVFSCYRI
jgi:hypothetical protein